MKRGYRFYRREAVEGDVGFFCGGILVIDNMVNTASFFASGDWLLNEIDAVDRTGLVTGVREVRGIQHTSGPV